MKILVDADACPVKEILVEEARRRNIPVTMLIDTCHILDDGYSTVITVDQGRDSADFRLVNLIQIGDIVVTQDYGVAAVSLARGAKALNQNGLVYSNGNIDRLLDERAIGQKIRRAGGRAGKNRKREKSNDEAFRRALVSLLNGE
ncbi:MAG TPA: YaiI/YqxD family protein [Clostridiales bacterium]|nr:YaiI/YqxD family protein [Clostridiales bacterium]